MELSIPDVWNQFEMLGSIDINEKARNDFFSETEKKNVKNRIEEVKKKVKLTSLSINNVQKIHQKLDDIYELVHKLKKGQWFELFLGSMISVILSLSLQSEVAKEIWLIISTYFSEWNLISLP